jgi:hypothetical protein
VRTPEPQTNRKTKKSRKTLSVLRLLREGFVPDAQA